MLILVLENINTSIKSEIINPNQNDKKVEILKKGYYY